MDHADWMQRHINASKSGQFKMHPTTPESLSDFQKKVVDILGIVGGGIYNAPINHNKINWNYSGGVTVVWNGRDLATFDFDELSKLVFLCHAARIRCSICGCGPRMIRMSFWQRTPAGDIAQRHPNIAEAVDYFEAALPLDSRLRFEAKLLAGAA